jgi:hypothetical protein
MTEKVKASFDGLRTNGELLDETEIYDSLTRTLSRRERETTRKSKN